MSRRSRAREVALQLLYEDDLNPGRATASIEQFLNGRLNDDEELVTFALGLISGVRRNRDELDELQAEIDRARRQRRKP